VEWRVKKTSEPEDQKSQMNQLRVKNSATDDTSAGSERQSAFKSDSQIFADKESERESAWDTNRIFVPT
jgi:hypothetical protein